jgi:hypothetical protein
LLAIDAGLLSDQGTFIAIDIVSLEIMPPIIDWGEQKSTFNGKRLILTFQCNHHNYEDVITRAEAIDKGKARTIGGGLFCGWRVVGW